MQKAATNQYRMSRRGRSQQRHRRKRFAAKPSIDAFARVQRIDTPAAISIEALENRPSVHPDSILDGRYRLKHRISTGGMGEVWVADHLALGFEVALKVLRADMVSDHECRARFRREAFVLTRLRTERVARVLDCFVDGTYGLVLVMELIQGTSLASLFAMRRRTVEEAIDLGIELSLALSSLHDAGVIHRDIKPANVILVPQKNGKDRVVVVDFGVSRLVQEGADEDTALTSITGAQSGVGTLQYMAPEQLLGAHHANHRVDIYGAGAVLYRAVTGRYVFADLEGTELAKAKLSRESPELSLDRWDPVAVGLQRVVNKALQRDPEQRYASAEQMGQDFLALRRSSPDRLPALRDLLTSGLPRAVAAVGIFIMFAVVCVLGLAALKMIPWAHSASSPTQPIAAKGVSNP